MIEGFLLLLETNRGHIFWSIHSHLRAASLEPLLQGHRSAAGLTRHQADKTVPFQTAGEGCWLLASTTASIKEVMQSRDVFQTDIPMKALPRERGGEQTTFFPSQDCPPAIARGLVGTNLPCFGSPLPNLHLTSPDHTGLSKRQFPLGVSLWPWPFLSNSPHVVVTEKRPLLELWPVLFRCELSPHQGALPGVCIHPQDLSSPPSSSQPGSPAPWSVPSTSSLGPGHRK